MRILIKWQYIFDSMEVKPDGVFTVCFFYINCFLCFFFFFGLDINKIYVNIWIRENIFLICFSIFKNLDYHTRKESGSDWRSGAPEDFPAVWIENRPM